MKTNYKYSCTGIIIMFMCFLAPLSGCRKFIEVVPPVTSVNEGNVYQSDATATASMIGIYSKMANSDLSVNVTALTELCADNLALFNYTRAYFNPFYQNALSGNNGFITHFWLTLYPFVFNANSTIEGVSNSSAISEPVKKNLLGEAYFLRAFYYFYLVNLYGDVPLVLTTDYKANATLPRVPVSQVYSQMISDLKQARSLLSDNYLQGDAVSVYPAGAEERVRPNWSAATALLARVYLYQQDWANAEQAATEVISKSAQFTLLPLDQAFLKNRSESIWALQTVGNFVNTSEGDLFTLREGEPDEGKVIYLSQDFMDSFQIGDQRKNIWTGNRPNGTMIYPYASKYKAIRGTEAVSEYAIVLRLGELYLVRAEAKIQQNNIAGGISDLNALRERAIDKTEVDETKRLKLLPGSLSKEEANTALMYERRVELFCEWGHRWFDLKRTGELDARMSIITPLKGGGDWKPFKALFPIPSDEIKFNSAIVQNPGYSN